MRSLFFDTRFSSTAISDVYGPWRGAWLAAVICLWAAGLQAEASRQLGRISQHEP